MSLGLGASHVSSDSRTTMSFSLSISFSIYPFCLTQLKTFSNLWFFALNFAIVLLLVLLLFYILSLLMTILTQKYYFAYS